MSAADPAPDRATAASGRLGKLLAMLERDPTDAFCLYGVAQEHAKSGKHQEAVAWFDRSLAADPNGAYACFHKARSLVELGRHADAVLTLREGLKAAARSGDSHAGSEITGFLTELGEDE